MTDIVWTVPVSDIDTDLTDEEDSRDQLRQSVAEKMAALSEASDTPVGFGPPSTIFVASEVDFASDDWIHQLAEVQGWLNMGSLPSTNRDDFLSTLVTELGLDLHDGLTSNGTTKQLSLPALERLNQRAEHAGRLQQMFLEHLEADAVSRAAATQAWSIAWEELVDDADESSTEPVIASAEVLPVSELTDSELNLTPSYQRGDVWTTADRQSLIESVLRGIPLPSLILLETGPNTPHEVVDGKQRLTALLRFVGEHPVAKKIVQAAETRHPGENLSQLFKTDYPLFRRKWKALEGENLSISREDAYYFPFKLRNSGAGGLNGPELEPLRGKYYTQITDHIVNVAGQSVSVQRLFTKTVAYKVPVIRYTRASPRQIHDVFKLYNKQGVHLNAEEIRNAAFHDIELTRAVLIAAGDGDSRLELAQVAPSLEGVPGLSDLGDTLRDFNFGITRYRRTKVLFWVLALLLLDTQGDKLRSTASHIDQLLKRIQSHPDDPLRNSKILHDLFTWLVQSIDLHARHPELWSEAFKDGKSGTKWQELQLVGSLVGIAVAAIGAPNDIEARLLDSADEILDASNSVWERPEKTQTKTQWEFVATVALGIVQILGVDPVAASAEIRDRFGSSGYESLESVLSIPDGNA